MNTADILRKAKATIADPKHWTQGAGSRRADGKPCTTGRDVPVCWCALGALVKVSTDKYGVNSLKAFHTTQDATHLLRDTLESMGEKRFVHTYNDSHTHAEVMALFDKAIDRAESNAAVGNAS